MNARLFIWTHQRVSLPDALRSFVGLLGVEGATALLYSPHCCELAVVSDGVLRDARGQPALIDSVFEARVFCEKAEFRWLKDPTSEERHRAVILAEEDLSPQLPEWQPEKPVDVIKCLSQTYLLWGEGTGRSIGAGWSELATARIGTLNVPVPNVGRNGRVMLHTVEYIVEAEHGNAVVLEERLVKLEVARG